MAVVNLSNRTGELVIPLYKVAMSHEAPELVAQVLRSGYIGQGLKVEQFETALTSHFGLPVVTTNSATSALHLAIHMVKDGIRDEILTTPLTCLATNCPILANGLRLRWVDVNPNDCNMDLHDLCRKISERTLAVMLVHWGGYACDLDSIPDIPVIEDCAHAWEARYKDRLLGTQGNTCVFSFQAIKHLTSGDGGALICQDVARAKLLRWYGLDRISNTCMQNIPEAGYKFHMNDINATIGLCNLLDASNRVRKHNENGLFYNDHLKDIPGVRVLHYEQNRYCSYWIYTMRVAQRTQFMQRMTDKGIAVSQVHARNDLHDCFAAFREVLPGMDELAPEMIAIPCGWWLTDEDRDYIVKTIKEGW